METGHDEGLEQLPGELLAMIFGTCTRRASSCLPPVWPLCWTSLHGVPEASRSWGDEALGGPVFLVSHLQRSLVLSLSSASLHHFTSQLTKGTPSNADSRVVWDQEQELRSCFPWVAKCSISFPSPDLFPHGLHNVSQQTELQHRSYSSIEKCNTFTWSVGFIDDNFDASTRVFNQPRHTICYSWCNKPSASHSVTGSPTEFSRQRKVLDGWKAGDVLGALLDFERREIQYFRNNKWNEMVKLHPESKRLWAMTNMFSSGNAVRVRIKSVGSIPPEWQLR
ncbi:hypothetical protein QOT17_014275 [Balamuthia mandrillaris]